MDFVTDLNHWERTAILVDLRAHIECAEKLVVALETHDDMAVMMETVIGSLSWGAVTSRLKPALIEAAEASKARAEINRFQGF